MKPKHIDRTSGVWVYSPPVHKNAFRGHDRRICIGPQAQSILLPFLERDRHDFLFSPKESEAARNARRRMARQTPGQPPPIQSLFQIRTNRRPGDSYTTDAYRRAIHRACEASNIPPWSPNQLRHNAATRIRKAHGIEAARVVLGQRSLEVAEIYAEADETLARTVMDQMG